MSDGSMDESLSKRMISDLISLIECEICSSKMIISPNSEFKQLFLVRKGKIKMFDHNYNYLCQLEQGSFFGEY